MQGMSVTLSRISVGRQGLRSVVRQPTTATKVALISCRSSHFLHLPTRRMPRTPKSAASSREAKPYIKHRDTSPSGESDLSSAAATTAAAATPEKPRRARSLAPGKAWSGEELKQLFHFALSRGERRWDEAVPGRTSSQSKQLWQWVNKHRVMVADEKEADRAVYRKSSRRASQGEAREGLSMSRNERMRYMLYIKQSRVNMTRM